MHVDLSTPSAFGTQVITVMNLLFPKVQITQPILLGYDRFQSELSKVVDLIGKDLTALQRLDVEEFPFDTEALFIVKTCNTFTGNMRLIMMKSEAVSLVITTEGVKTSFCFCNNNDTSDWGNWQWV